MELTGLMSLSCVYTARMRSSGLSDFACGSDVTNEQVTSDIIWF